MQIAVLWRPDDPVSLRVYATNMSRNLADLGVEVVRFAEQGPIPDGCDFVWDPGLCMRRLPSILERTAVPVIGTMHGVKAFALPLAELEEDPAGQRVLATLRDELAAQWRGFRERVRAVIAVSDYAAREVRTAFDLPASLVQVVHNAADPGLFSAAGPRAPMATPYFLAVGSANPIKNLRRVIAAHGQMQGPDRPALVVVATGLRTESAAAGVRVIGEELTQAQLAQWYRGAVALVFPSLRETFGMPILEAMACGCPVITAWDTGCAEVAGDAALRVDPRSVPAITAAMERLANEPELRERLRQAGARRVMQFSWRESARRLVGILQAIVPEQHKRTPRMRKLEITTAAGCSVACRFCPQTAFTLGYHPRGGGRLLEWDDFEAVLDKLPAAVGISFGGMSEPFQHPRCADMILHARSRGHVVEVFSTLAGLAYEELVRLLAALRLGPEPTDDRLFVHLPSVEGLERIPLDPPHLRKLRRLTQPGLAVEFHYHGASVHPALRGIPFGERLQRWPIHDRADNEAAALGKGRRKRGPLSCIMNREVNVLLPNGDVLLCSQDFAARHVIGNLLRQPPEALYVSAEFLRVGEGMTGDDDEILCRHCHFAVLESADVTPA